ncbi:hypothetical protein J5T34_03560 [Cupriavidus gilardii]|uniref:hypothetical protein n=1 Tax=Cupriavidus gilardii TaxID=82541 RepID=UPI001ABDC602|nr:hypothetical protein [Cupriavidus gilardii]MBO4119815.1 hypothetical protein [Cupriavidus gilardii]
MPATYPTASVFLEAHFFAYDHEELRLSCDAVTVHPDTILVRGIEARHLNAICWIPDALSFQAYDRHHRFPVGRPIVLERDVAQFPLL